MERIISYDELPDSQGQSIHLRMETDPKLYLSLFSKGYRIVRSIYEADEATIYVTGKRQAFEFDSVQDYWKTLDRNLQQSFRERGIVKPNTVRFSFEDLLNHRYSLPFVFKNEKINGGKEKFLIQTEDDYENLIQACRLLIERNLLLQAIPGSNSLKGNIDYDHYLHFNFSVQEYISTPSEYNTTVRLLTSSSNDLLYAALKYKKPDTKMDNTTLLGFLLHEVYPLSTQSIVSNTVSGGENILLGEDYYSSFEENLLAKHQIDSDAFHQLVQSAQDIHQKYHSELGILCGSDFIYDQDKNKWFLLEYHDVPMVGDYSKRFGIPYQSREDRITAGGRVRATALSLALKKTR